MKQILFAVLLCVSSICSAQNLTSQGSDRSYAEPLDGDTFHLKIKNKYNYAVDSDNPLCNIVKFKRISENEMLLVGSKQDYRLTADLPFKLEWGKVNNEFFHGFELRGLYVCAPNYSAGMTIRVKVEDASQTPIFDKVYSLLTPIDLYVEYVGTDQKKYTANLSNGWFEHDIDYKKDIRLFLKTRDGKILPPISKVRFSKFDCMDCSLPEEGGSVLSANLREFLARGRSLGASGQPWLNDRVYISVYFRIGTEDKVKHFKMKKSWPFGTTSQQSK